MWGSRGGGRGRGWARSGSARPSRRSVDHLWSSRQQLCPGVTPPDASSSARPSTWATAAATCSGVMLSSSSRGAPAASASSISAASRTSTASGRSGRAARARRTASPTPPASAAVVLLDQDEVVQAGAVVHAAAVGDRALLEAAQAGRRLARVEQLSRSRRPSAIARTTCAVAVATPGEPAEEVERGALGGQQRAGGALDAQHRRRRLAPLALRAEPLDRRVRVEPEEHRLGDVEPRDHARRLLRDRGDAARGRVDGRLDGHVAGADVLRQRAVDQILGRRNGHADQYSRGWAGRRRCASYPADDVDDHPAATCGGRRWSGSRGRSPRGGARRRP